MSNLEVKDLFADNRFPESTRKLIYLLLYTPIGIIILIIRLLSGLLALLLASALPDVATLRTTITNLLSFSLGVFVEKRGVNNRDASVKIIISNHISNLDHLVLHIAADSYTLTNYRMQDILENALGLLHVNRDITSDLIINSDKVLAFFPEEVVTNGKGLLKFKSKVFDYNIKIQPVAIEVWRPPVADIAIKSLGSQWWSDIVTYLFVPCTIYSVKFLPIMHKEDNMDDVIFVENVRDTIAKSLKIPATSLTAKDLIEYEKRYIFDENRALRASMESRSINMNLSSRPAGIDSSVELMARQVKEVLPFVPHNVILQDLTKTRNVDYTISNILDGNVRYTPETPPRNTNTTSSSSASTGGITASTSYNSTGSSSSISSVANQQTSCFPKSASERMLTFQERKRELIENARKRYIEKHGLNIALNNC